MLPLLLISAPFLTNSEVCEVDVSIGLWLKNNTNLSCDTVKGHFVLDKTASSHARELYNTFGALKRIEGCIYVKNYSGSRNLSFFSMLEEVICDKTKAIASKLKDVIHVDNPYLYKMGFNSLRNVTGPGEIFLSFEIYQQTYQQLFYQESYNIEKRTCFSKKEMVFFARHPQFKGKMYRACETDDPCFRPELFTEFYTFMDIPDNCTTFVGFICLAGPYPDDLPVFEKFKLLTLLIGVLQVGPNLFDSLHMFSNLEVVYPYQTGNASQGCYGDSFDLESSRDLQPVYIGLNRFMKNISLPSLKPIRPLEVNEPFIRRPISNLLFTHDYYFPDNFEKPCDQFPQFGKKCRLGYQYNEGRSNVGPDPFVDEAWLLGTIFVAMGLVFAKRSLVTLFTGQLNSCTPKTQYFIATVMVVMILSAIEGVIINQAHVNSKQYVAWPSSFLQRTFQTGPGIYNNIHVFSVFSNPHFLHPCAQEVIRLLAVCRQTSLFILILCYPGIILSYCWKRWNHRFPRLYAVFASILALIAFLYFSSKLAIETRIFRPLYRDSQITFMALVLNIDKQENFTLWLPPRISISDKEFLTIAKRGSSWVELVAKDMQLDVLGASFPEICLYCDVVFTILVIGFFALRVVSAIDSRDNFNILIVLEMNLINMNLSFGQSLAGYWTQSEFEKLYMYWFTDDNLLWIFIRIIEKLPYFSFMVASFLCWRYTLYNRNLGMALIYREAKKKENSTRLSREHVSNISFVTNLERK